MSDVAKNEAAFLSLPLTPEEENGIRRFNSFGAAWVDGALRTARARKWLESNCEIIREKTSSRQSFRCCTEGTIAYRRKDGSTISDDDFTALKQISNGQSNSYKLSQDRSEMYHKYFCDSGD